MQLLESFQQDSYIMQMSSYDKEQILRTLIKMFNESDIERFTLIIKQTPLKNADNKKEFTLNVDEICSVPNIHTTRPKSSTIDRFYRTSHFLNYKKSMTTRRENSQDSFDEDSHLPDSPKELGLKFYRVGDYAQALSIFEELKEHFPLQNSNRDYKIEYREILNNLGNCYFRLEKYDRAISTYKELIRDYGHEDGDDHIRGRLYNNLGCCYGKLGYEKLSMNSYNQALKIYSRNTATDTSSLLYNIANIYFNCQMYDVCQRYFEQAIHQREAKNPNDKMLLFHAYSKLSLAQIQQRKCRDALQNLNRALKLTEGGTGEPLEILRQCAYVKELEGKWEEALEFYEKMHLLHDKTKKTKGFIFESVANIYLNIGKIAEHRKYIQLSLEEYRKDGNERKICELANNWSCQKLIK